MGKEWIAVLKRELRGGLTERHLMRNLKEVRERAVQISGGRAFWADGTHGGPEGQCAWKEVSQRGWRGREAGTQDGGK